MKEETKVRIAAEQNVGEVKEGGQVTGVAMNFPQAQNVSVRIDSADSSVFQNLLAQYSAVFSSTKKEKANELRELIRMGKSRESLRQVSEIRNSLEWPLLEKNIQADFLLLEAGLVLDIDNDIPAARQLSLQARELNPDKDQTIIDTLLCYYEKGPEAALGEILECDNIDKINLRAGLLLETGKVPDVISLLKSLPNGMTPNAETRRLLALARLASGNISQAKYEIQKAVEEKPEWMCVRIASGKIDYCSALSATVLHAGYPVLPEPVGLSFVNRNDDSLNRLRNAEKTFHELLRDMEDDPETKRHFQVWQLACLYVHPDRLREAEAFCRDLLKDGDAHTGVLFWALSMNTEYDFTEYQDKFENRLENDDIKLDEIQALVQICLKTKDYDKTLSVLDQAQKLFPNTKDRLLWPFWKAMTLLKSGKIKEAIAIAEDSGEDDFQIELFGVGLNYAKPESEEWLHLLNHLEKMADAGNSPALFLVCEAKARRGDKTDWEYVAANADDLVSNVRTAVSVKLAIFALFNSGLYQKCHDMLLREAGLFSSKHFPEDLRRLRIQCQIQCGKIPQALSDAEDLARANSSFDNLVSLLEAQHFGGERWKMIPTARQLLRCESAVSVSLLRTARLIRSENLHLAQELWRKAMKTGIDEELVPEALTLGYNLGLEFETRSLMEKMHELAREGKSGVKAVPFNELIELQKEWLEESNRIWRLYETAAVQIHLIAHAAGWAFFAYQYLGHVRRDVASFDPLHQPVTFIRYGGRSIDGTVIPPDSSCRLFMDSTAFMIAAHLDILDLVEECFETLLISPSLPMSLNRQKDLLSPHHLSRLNGNREIIGLFDAEKMAAIQPEKHVAESPNGQENKLDRDRASLLELAKDTNGYLVDFLPLKTHNLANELIILSGEDAERVIEAEALATALFQVRKLNRRGYEETMKKLGRGKDYVPSSTVPKTGDTLYLAGGIPGRLVRAGLLGRVCREFHVTMLNSDLDRVRSEMASVRIGRELIDEIKIMLDRITDRIKTGKYEYADTPLTARNEFPSEQDPDFLSCLHMLEFTAKDNDIIWSDDRALNKYLTRDNNIPIIGINEVLLHLKSKGRLSEEDYYEKLMSLRAANFRYIPIGADEMIHHLKDALIMDNRLFETEPLSILRQYAAACLSDSDRLQMPPKQDLPMPMGEAIFGMGFHQMVHDVLLWIWKHSGDETTAWVRANWVLENIYVGVSGTFCHISAKSDDDMLQLTGMDISRLISLGIELIGVQIEKNEERLRWYFNWITYCILEKRLRVDPSTSEIAAISLKHILEDLESSELETELLDSMMPILSLFFQEIPKAVKSEVCKDKDFIEKLGIKTAQVVHLESFCFESGPFYKALAEIAKGNESTITDFGTGERYTVKPVFGDGEENAFLLIKEGDVKECKMKSDILPLLGSDLRKREEFLRNLTGWFDCEKNQRKKAITEIVNTDDPVLRVKRVGEWRSSSAAMYYSRITQRIQQGLGIKPRELIPPDAAGQLRHLRFPKSEQNSDFSKIHRRSAETLVREEGLRAAFERLAGLPVRLPGVLFDEFSKLDDRDKRQLFNSWNVSCHSPVSVIHMIHLSLRFTNGDDDYLEYAKNTFSRLADPDNSVREFRAFLALLNWVYDEFYLWPEMKDRPSSFRLATVWSHTNRIYNLFRQANYPFDWFVREFGFNLSSVFPESLDRDLSLWNDACHPRRVNYAPFYLKGLAAGCAEIDVQFLEKTDVFEFIDKISFVTANEKQSLNPALFLNVSLMSNSMESYLGSDSSIIGIFLGENFTLQFSLEKLNELADDILANLDKEPMNHLHWTFLSGIISDLPVGESVSLKLKSIVEKMDLEILKDQTAYAVMVVLYAVTCRLNSFGDDNLREKIRGQLVGLARHYSGNEPQYQDSAQTSGIMAGVVDVKGIMLESALRASIVEGNPEKSSHIFSDLMIKMIQVWPDFGAYARPAVFELAMELPVAQSKHLWRLLMVSRACGNIRTFHNMRIQKKDQAETGKTMENKISVEQNVRKVSDDGKVVGVEININYPEGEGKKQQTGEKKGKEVTGASNYQLNVGQKGELINALLGCASLSDRATRDAIVNELPADIRNTIQRHAADRVDVSNIVSRCMDFADGIGKLIVALKNFEGPSLAMNRVEALFDG